MPLFAVVVLEDESDTVGIDAAFGPFDTYGEASALRDSLCRDHPKPYLVQVTSLTGKDV